MKIHSSFLLLGLMALLPARAQTMNVGTPSAGDSRQPVQQIAATPRGINPVTLNHKPNPVPPPPEIAAPIDRFFKTLKTGDYVNAYETFLSGTRLGTQTEKTSIFISKTQEAFGIYGALNDYEIYDNYTIGSNVIILTYLSRHQVQPLRWRFIFYRADKSWGVINMGFDDVLLDMLD